MRPELEHIATIEQYLEGTLTPEQQAAFEQRLQENPALQQEVEEQAQLTKRLSRAALVLLINDAHHQFNHTGGGNASWINNIWLNVFIGALIVAGTITGIYFGVNANDAQAQNTGQIESNAAPAIVYTPDVETDEALPSLLPAFLKGTPGVPSPNCNSAMTATNKTAPVVVAPVEDAALELVEYPGLNIPFNEHLMRAEDGAELTDQRSGTIITIPANALMYADGSDAKGIITIKYREYRDQADIAISNIPMTYKQVDEEYNFNSAGMLEVRAYQNGQEVFMKPEHHIHLQFELTDTIPDLNFYALNDTTQQWEFLETVEQGKNPPPNVFNDGQGNAIDPQANLIRVGKHPGWFRRLLIRLFGDRFVRNNRNDGEWDNMTMEDDGDRSMGTLIESSDPGHTYPPMVRGLQANNFGVYNCDQMYRVKDRIHIMANYVDEQGKQLNGKVLSMIDLDYNGAFSFNPADFSCGKNGRNVLLLFTPNKAVYLLSEEKYKAMNISESGRYEFVMQEITNEVKTADDLKRVLGI